VLVYACFCAGLRSLGTRERLELALVRAATDGRWEWHVCRWNEPRGTEAHLRPQRSSASFTPAGQI
jgi:hypothetical protein